MTSGFCVYFGGSFFPPHVGHDEMLCSLLRHPDVGELRLVPTFQNPLKNTAALADMASLKRRFIKAWQDSLIARRVEGYNKLRIDWRELDRGCTSYTVDTLRDMLSERAASRLPWVLSLGDDSLADLARWKDIEALLTLVREVWVFPRGPRTERAFVNEIPEALRALTTWRLMLAEITDVSSTEVRKTMELSFDSQDRLRLKALVLPEVFEVL